MLIKISWDSVADALGVPETAFPKYVSPLLNLANRYAQATRPRVVGQMSDLMDEFSGHSLAEWERWYSDRQPGAIEEAIDRIEDTVGQFREALETVDREMIAEWVHDLVISKTYQGMRLQLAILQHIADELDRDWRRATAAEEAIGIDGYIGGKPVSVKPDSYAGMKQLSEEIGASMIVYTRTRSHLEVQFDEEDFT